MKRFVFVLAILLSFASSVYSQTLDTTRVNTTFGYDVYRSGVLIERHTTTPTGETVTRYVAGPGGTCATGAVVSINANGIATCSAAPPLVNPIFTGQWTVNSSLCTAEQILQGGSPTVCTAAPTLHSGLFFDSTKTFASYYRTAGTYGSVNLVNSTTGGLDFRGYVQTLDYPAIRLAAEGAVNFSDNPPNHVPYVLVQAIDWNGGFPVYNRKLFSACTYAVRTICDDMQPTSGQVMVTNGLFPVTIDDGTFDVFALGTAVLRTRALNPGTQANDIGIVEAPGLVLQNPVATHSGGPTVEYSPSLDLQGSAWNSSGNQTELDTWRLTNRPVSVAGTTTSVLCSRSSINNSSFTDRFCVTSAGLGTLATTNNTVSQQLNGVVVASATAPTIASGGCSSPAVTWANGTEAFLLTIGSSCSGVKTITLTMPASAHFWKVSCDNNTSDARQILSYVVNRSTSTTAAVLTHYARTTGLQADFTASDTFLCEAHGG